ncbi:PAS domain S-box protein [Sneathiella sp. P13V-1]|uniref:sensor histidine kinase n=1 Tax=Sneathiella sp. P13V-1 TaxID=2697366 RepID=UPI00187BA3B2|nr:PAS domain-containing sensor histidine kinase [Sneathiella sp. P13V-1]MBE7638339.1 PAS domain S-box protein [Sneathiella sp. P13V-1]
MHNSPENSELLLDALENISEAFVVYDKNGYLVTCNSKFLQLYGYTEEEAKPGTHYRELGEIDIRNGNVVVGDEYGSGEEYLERKRKYREELQGSFTVNMKDGRWIKTTDRPLSNGGFVSVQSDITDIKNNEAQLLEAKERAEYANRAKSEFMANMSHELRTPLNAIIGFSSLLSSAVYGAHSDERYGEYAEDIQNAGEHLLSLINEVLDLAKIETGDIVLDEQKVDIWPLLQSCQALSYTRSKEKNIQIDLDVEPANLVVYGDQIRLKQIVINLLGNAMKFSPNNSRVKLECKLEEGCCVLRVCDNGVGIEKEFFPNLYTPFQRSQIAQNLQCEGTGLGLTMVKRFADAHGATVTVESEPDAGTQFEIIFPEDRTYLINKTMAS